MTRDHNERLVGTNAVAVEMAVLTLLSPIVWGLPTFWQYDWLFLITAAVIGMIFLIRIMAGMADNPDVELIRRSLRWSSALLDFLLVGALAAISIRISTIIGFTKPVTVFTVLAVVLSLGFVLLDQRVLGEYIGTWKSEIYEETEDNAIGRLIREAADFSERQFAIFGSDKSPDTHADVSWGLGLFIVLFLALFFVSLPVLVVLSIFFDNWTIAVLVLISLLFLRDTTRYIYIQYGAASGLSELRWSLKWGFIWTSMKGIVIAWMLGYEIGAVL